MSFVRPKKFIEEGDTVIIYLSPNNLKTIRVLRTMVNKHGVVVPNVYQTSYGALKVDSLIGKRYGIKVQLSKGWAYVLAPTAELWSLTLPHRTQIIYTPDASSIVFQLELSPGKHVLEAGTGSGSLTHALARAVHPGGRVSTFDFHEHRVRVAAQEFQNHQLDGIVKVERRDVCTEGFNAEHAGTVDAIFLDLPHPWRVVPHTPNMYRTTGGRFCSFSPCIEQVQKTVLELIKLGYFEIRTQELVVDGHLIQTKTLPVPQITYEETDLMRTELSAAHYRDRPAHTGYLTTATMPPVWARYIPEDPSLLLSEEQCVEVQIDESLLDDDEIGDEEPSSEPVAGPSSLQRPVAQPEEGVSPASDES